MDTPVTWLLDEHGGEESGVSDLRPAIEAIGDQHLTISRREARYGTAELTVPLHACPTLAYGSIEFAKAIRPELYPGNWCDWTALRCERYYARVGDYLLNDDYILLPVGEVRRRQKSLLKLQEPLFVRPSRADKPFSGFVITRDNLAEVEQQLQPMEEYDLVVLASAKVIEAEYRTLAVRGNGIAAASQYMAGGELAIAPEIPVEAREIAEAVVKALGYEFPDPMYVVDIAQSKGKYHLLEINSFSASIFYACDLEAIVRAAHQEALREWKEMQG